MNENPSSQMPVAMSTYAQGVDNVYYLIFWLSVVLFVGIMAAAAFFALSGKRKPGVKAEPTGHNMVLELGWTVAPVFILAYLFWVGWKGYVDLATVPPSATEVRGRAFQWGWDFEYANGVHSKELKAPVGKPVKVILSSNDVLHAFFVPQFRIKRDTVPGMYSTTWFEANQVGEADIFCAEYCGGKGEGDTATGHWAMIGKVKVLPAEEFDKFLKEGNGPKEGETVADWGKRLYAEKNCAGCHSIDGGAGAGPSWKGLYGRSEPMSDGTNITADENYIRESILEPQAHIVKGFGPVMPSYKGILQDKEIDAIISFMKTLK